MEFEVLSDNTEFYHVKDKETGEEKKLFKINMDQLKLSHLRRVREVAAKLEYVEIDRFITELEYILQRDINIDEYLSYATSLAKQVRRLYEIVGSPNLFHHPVKNIDPCIYGKAQTFNKEVRDLLQVAKEIKHEKGEMDGV